jgi:hypothetical protein
MRDWPIIRRLSLTDGRTFKNYENYSSRSKIGGNRDFEVITSDEKDILAAFICGRS